MTERTFTRGTGFTDDQWTGFVKPGIETWESLVTPYGGSMVVLTETSSNPDVTINGSSQFAGGSHYCQSGKDVITIGYQSVSDSKLDSLAAHEMGHVFNAHHAGRYDSHDGKIPVMATKMGFFPGARAVRQDDNAQLHQRRYKSELHANSSFEQGTKFWGMSGSLQLKNSGGVDGPKYVRHSTRYGYIYQTVRVVEPETLAGRINYRRGTTSNVSGNVAVQLKYRRVDYPTGSGWCPPGTGDSTGNCYNLNNADVVSPWYSGGAKYYGANHASWQESKDTGNLSLGSWEGADIRIYAYNYAYTTGGGSVSMDFDHVRAMRK